MAKVVIHGYAAAPGLGIGRAYIHRDHPPGGVIAPARRDGETAAEYARIQLAIQQVLSDLALCAQQTELGAHKSLALIFQAQREMLNDPEFVRSIEARMERTMEHAELVVHRVLEAWERRFMDMKDAWLKERADDVADLRNRLLRALVGSTGHPLSALPENCVMIAERLLPSEAVFLSQQATAGIILEQGSAGSHAILLAKGMGIPAVVQVSTILDNVRPDDMVIVDAARGRVVVNPDQPTVHRFRGRTTRIDRAHVHARKQCGKPATYADGGRIPVQANVCGPEDSERAARNGADGIGLYRTEALYMAAERPLTEEELFEGFAEALHPFQGKPVSIRLLDVGGDKSLPCLDTHAEPNPFLGKRGVRLLLDRPDLLEPQLKAILRLCADHDIRILIPMVTHVGDIARVKVRLATAATALGVPAPPLGSMIETPAAALCAPEVAEQVDFVSIGTNDLTQYVMAADRDNPAVQSYYQDTHDAVFRLIRIVCDGVADKPVALCGSLAGRVEAIPRLLRLGIRQLSVEPPLVPMVKEWIRSCGARQLRFQRTNPDRTGALPEWSYAACTL